MLKVQKLALVACAVLALFLSTLSTSPNVQAGPGGGNLDKIEPALLRAMLANPAGNFDVIIRTEAPGKSASAQANSERSQGAVNRAKAHGAKKASSLAIIGGAAAQLSADSIYKLSRDPFVSSIIVDSPVQVFGTPATALQSLFTQIVRAPEVWATGNTGQGIGVAVVDSGIAPNADLQSPLSRVVASVDFVDSLALLSDPGGHGTHVAGIVGGNGANSAQAWQGVAPGANLVSVRVINSTGNATLSTVVRGIQWVVQNRKTYNIRVMNLSLGATATRGYRDDPLASAVEMAWHSGIVVTVAAGNGGPGPMTIATPATDPFVITVGALDDNGTLTTADDSIASFSSLGPTLDSLNKPDVVAPGRRIVSLRTPGSYLDGLLPDRITDLFYFRLSGTSMSSPVVAGSAALMLANKPSLKPNQVKALLMQTARAVTGGQPNSAGAGLIDVFAAVNYNGAPQANKGLTPSDDFCKSVRALLQGMPLSGIWRDPYYKGINWANITWDNITWDRTTWDNITWENITWDNITWNNITWENITWDAVIWDVANDTGTTDNVMWNTLN